MDEQAYQIIMKVNNLMQSVDPITDTRRAYMSGLLEAIVTMYQAKQDATEGEITPPHNRFLDKFRITNIGE